jgi:predicted RecB family nuclease
MGWCDTQGHTHIALVAAVQLPASFALPDDQPVTLVPDSDSAWEVFAEAVNGSDGPVYHWSGYDAALLRHSAPGYIRSLLEPRLHDLNATLRRVLSLPLTSTSIKQVATYLGFDWPGHQDYRAAYVDYRAWLDSGDETTLVRACTYQRADVQSLAHVWRWLNAMG